MTDQDFLAQLEQIEAATAALRAAIQRRSEPQAALVHALAEATGGDPFTVADAVSDALTAKFPSLGEALDMTSDRNARRLGHALSSLEDLEIKGLILRRVSSDRTGVIWQVVAAPPVR